MKKDKLFYNGLIYPQVFDNRGRAITVDSLAIEGNNIIAAGRGLENDVDFRNFEKYDLKGRTVLPGFTDAHTHIGYYAATQANVKLDGMNSLDDVLAAIRNHCRKLKQDEWVFGDGYSPDRWKEYVTPDKNMLDKVTGGRPAAFFSKDQHNLWVNSAALEIAGITARTKNPLGGIIERFPDGEPLGILKEKPAFSLVLKFISGPDIKRLEKHYRNILKIAYSNGVTAVHSFDDSADSFSLFMNLNEKKRLGLRINYYPPAAQLPNLLKNKTGFNFGDDYLRISGIKIFADGSLGSQSALCFQKYIGSRHSFGVETTPRKQIINLLKIASRLNLPAAIHAIGDRAVANVLDSFEKAPKLSGRARHRMEHVQMIRRQDIMRLKKLGITASMQPSHCPSDINLIEKYWGTRGRNCFVFNTLLKNHVPLAFGSDAPIEPLEPLAGINAAVNRRRRDSRLSFYPEERISVAQAVFAYTAGAAYAVGQEQERGSLLPGNKADFIILSDNIYKQSRSKIGEIKVLQTFFDGHLVYSR